MGGGTKPITIVPFENVGGQTTLMGATKGGSFNKSIYFPEAFLPWGLLLQERICSLHESILQELLHVGQVKINFSISNLP